MLCGDNRTHDFTLGSIYHFQFGPAKPYLRSGFFSYLARGWQINPVLTRASGTPFTVTSSGASLNAREARKWQTRFCRLCRILGGHGAGARYFNPAAYAPITAVRFGTSARNGLRGPGLFELDAELARTFDLTERFKLQFKADASALTNTPNFANPSILSVSNASFVNGQISNLNGFAIIPGPTALMRGIGGSGSL